jgi:O-antigen/teichoic acid export membrane protein
MSENTGRSRGVLWLVGLRFVIIFLQIISLAISVRVLGEGPYAVAAYFATVRVLWQFVDLDIPQGLIQILSKTFRVDEAKAWLYFRSGLFLHLIIGAIGAIGLFLGPLYLGRTKELLNYPGLSLLCTVAGLQFFFDTYGSAFNAPFNAREQFSKVAKLTSIVPFFAIVFTITLVFLLRSPVAILAGSLFDSVTQFILKMWFIRKYEPGFPILPKVDKTCCRDLIQMGLKSYVAGLSTRIASIFDKVIIFNVLGKELYAVYNIACRIPQILLEAFSKVVESVTPEMTHISTNEPHKLAEIFRRNFKFIGFIAAIGIMFVSGFGDVIQRAWLNKHYENFGLIVLLMGIYYGLELHHSTITRVFFAQGKPQMMLPFSLWNSVITLTCTAFLAKRFGLLGPAYMNCFIDLSQIIPIHYFCSKYGVKEISTGELLKITGTIVGPGALLGFLFMTGLSFVTPGRWCYFGVLAIPFLCVGLAAVYNRFGLVDLPNGVKTLFQKFQITRNLFRIPN